MIARETGIVVGTGARGPRDAITDVPGVTVGHTTLISGDGALHVGAGPVRTGVTVVVPHPDVWTRPVFAGTHRLNGNGEVTGLEWIRECGLLSTPIALTNTHSVGVVRDAIAQAHVRARPADGLFWSLPVVGETYDGILNDINGGHVTAAHVDQALAAAGEDVAEGSVGGGTGMICHEFKGGIGTASRVAADAGGFTVGVLVQANHGRRERLAVNGVPVGALIGVDAVPAPHPPENRLPGAGSIVVVVATDAPLLPHQCTRLAQRAVLGIGRTGGTGEHDSGDLVVAFATGNRGLAADVWGRPGPLTADLTMLRDEHMTPLFDAAVEATEAAIVSALLAAETMVGRDGVTAHGLDAERLRRALERGDRS